jgi:hypothetical protein
MAQMKCYVPGHLAFNFTGAKTLMDHATWSKVLVSNRDYVERTATFSFHWHTGACKAPIKSCQSEGCHPTDSDFVRTFTQVQMVEGVADPCTQPNWQHILQPTSLGKFVKRHVNAMSMLDFQAFLEYICNIVHHSLYCSKLWPVESLMPHYVQPQSIITGSKRNPLNRLLTDGGKRQKEMSNIARALPKNKQTCTKSIETTETNLKYSSQRIA